MVVAKDHCHLVSMIVVQAAAQKTDSMYIAWNEGDCLAVHTHSLTVAGTKLECLVASKYGDSPDTICTPDCRRCRLTAEDTAVVVVKGSGCTHTCLDLTCDGRKELVDMCSCGSSIYTLVVVQEGLWKAREVEPVLGIALPMNQN